jgi:hypothetical protein
VTSIRARLERLQKQSPRSVIDELLLHQQPIHFGGMSDPFLPAEEEMGITLNLLEVLAEHKYPTVISTKNNLFVKDKYLKVLKRGQFIVQASISSLDSKLLSQVDLGTPGPNALIQALAILRREGIPTACRIQPLLPGHEADAYDVIDACADVGVKHVAVEHMKLSMEKTWHGTKRLSAALNNDLELFFISKGARRIGRELILPPSERLERMLQMRSYTHQKRMTFGAADNDFLLFSDGVCCCSGVDLIQGFGNSFKYNYTEAVRRGLQNKTISLDLLNNVWYPSGSIGQYMNSHSRIKTDVKQGASINEYIKRNWNGSAGGNSPLALYGVVETGEYDAQGYKIYAISDQVVSVAHTGSIR